MHRAAARRRKSCGNECTLTLRAGAWARHASSAADVILLRASRSSLRWVSEDQWQAPRPTASMPLPSRVISLAAVQRSKSTSVTMALSLCAANTDSIPRGHNLSKDAERTSTYTPLLWSPHTSTHPPTHPSRPIRTAVPIAPIPQTCRIQRPNSPTTTPPCLAKGPPNNNISISVHPRATHQQQLVRGGQVGQPCSGRQLVARDLQSTQGWQGAQALQGAHLVACARTPRQE